jgi:hypothetical protein
LEVLKMFATLVALAVGFLLGVMLMGLIVASSRSDSDAARAGEVLQIPLNSVSSKERTA